MNRHVDLRDQMKLTVSAPFLDLGALIQLLHDRRNELFTLCRRL